MTPRWRRPAPPRPIAPSSPSAISVFRGLRPRNDRGARLTGKAVKRPFTQHLAETDAGATKHLGSPRCCVWDHACHKMGEGCNLIGYADGRTRFSEGAGRRRASLIVDRL